MYTSSGTFSWSVMFVLARYSVCRHSVIFMVNFSNQIEVCKICFEIPIANCIVGKDIN